MIDQTFSWYDNFEKDFEVDIEDKSNEELL